MNALLAKAPFNPTASVQASPAEVAALLQPGTGQLWQFYNANLKSLLIQQGSTYGLAPNPPMQVNAAFVRFFNRAAEVSSTFFPPGATGAQLTFVLRNEPTKGVRTASIKVDAQTLSLSDPQKQFTWQAATASSASLTANDLPLTFTGPWAIFELVNKSRAQRGAGAGGVYELSFPLELANTPVRAPDGTPIVVNYELSGPGASVLAPGALADLRCVGTVAR
jgi:type VI secretion system protein ImpL